MRPTNRQKARVGTALCWALTTACAIHAAPPDHAAAYEALRQRHQGASAMRAFERRLALVAEVRQDLEAAFDQHRALALDALLDDTLGVSALPAPEEGESPQAESAVQILRRYSSSFAQPLSASAFTQDEQAILRDRYSASIRDAGSRIAEHGRSVAAADPDQAMRAMALSLVLPLLHVPDGEWRSADLDSLPRWVRDGANLEQLERFALRCQRPLTAYVFATEGSTGPPPEVAAYLDAAADRLLRGGQYAEALACLAAGERRALENGDHDRAIAFTFRQAQVLDDTGDPEHAAEAVRRLLTDDAEADVFGRAAMLLLKYLHGAGRPQDAVNESRVLQKDERARAYLPQILYITWVSARRTGADELAARTRQDFHKRYPDHILGADLFFAEAMEALARSDYPEADRLLEYIAYRYPDSRLMKRVQGIQKRLAEQAEKQREQSRQARDGG